MEKFKAIYIIATKQKIIGRSFLTPRSERSTSNILYFHEVKTIVLFLFTQNGKRLRDFLFFHEIGNI